MQELIDRVRDLKADQQKITDALYRIADADRIVVVPVEPGAAPYNTFRSFHIPQPILYSALLKQRAEVERQLEILGATFVTDETEAILATIGVAPCQ